MNNKSNRKEGGGGGVRKKLVFATIILSVLTVVPRVTKIAVVHPRLHTPTPTPPASNTTVQPASSTLLTTEDTSVYPEVVNSSTSPVVIEQYKLVLFTVPKAGSTALKQLCRRMMNYSDYAIHTGRGIPHIYPGNGLKYLSLYPLSQANEMMTSPDWTRAIFVRGPKERVLSAFLHWRGGSLHKECCARISEGNESLIEKCRDDIRTFPGFIRHIELCPNTHWTPLCHYRMEDKFWPYINFVGRVETAQDDVKRLLNKLGQGVYDKFGASGWGTDGKHAAFQSTTILHSTDAAPKVEQYYRYSPELEDEIERIYACEYENTVLGLQNRQISAPK